VTDQRSGDPVKTVMERSEQAESGRDGSDALDRLVPGDRT
jgi:hypothetical protein